METERVKYFLSGHRILRRAGSSCGQGLDPANLGCYGFTILADGSCYPAYHARYDQPRIYQNSLVYALIGDKEYSLFEERSTCGLKAGAPGSRVFLTIWKSSVYA